MSIKSRLTFFICVLFILSMAGVSLFTYYFISQYRENTFMQQLQQKAITVADVLFRSNEKALDFVSEIEKETTNEFHKEKILVFNEKHTLIYNSVNEVPMEYSDALLSEVSQKTFLKQQHKTYELYAQSFHQNGQELIILISAYDKYGIATLYRLENILLVASVFGIALLIFSVFLVVKRSLSSLDILNEQVDVITENNLRQTISMQSKNEDEVTRLTKSYNKMMVRLADAFDNQKQFVQHASHELRTPLSVMLLELDNAIMKADDRAKVTLLSLKEELQSLIDLTNSLLLLSKLTYEKKNLAFHSTVRIDEILFDIMEEIQSNEKAGKIKIEIKSVQSEEDLSVPGNQVLLKMMFRNLIENACKYAVDNTAIIEIGSQSGHLEVKIKNNGDVIEESEREHLFTPLFRASNSIQIKGFGVGLSIVKQIATYHSADVNYSVAQEDGSNQFTIVFQN